MKDIYRPYWKTWAALLALTVVMIAVDVMELPRVLMLAVLLGVSCSATAFESSAEGEPTSIELEEALVRSRGDGEFPPLRPARIWHVHFRL